MRASSVNDIAAIVRGRRRDLGLSQSALAEMVGVSRKWVSEFEGGKASAELGLVMRSLEILGLNIDVSDRVPVRSGIDLDELISEHGRDG